MINDDFLAKCRSLNPSAEIDREKNRKIIKTRLLERENIDMLKNKRVRRPVVAAAVLAGILSLSVIAYAAVPAVWRYFNTEVTQGEEFVTDFWMGEIDLPDGTTSVGGGINIDREALEAAGGGAVIVEVDGEEWVMLDELHIDSIEEGLALLQIENPLIPRLLPEGFAFYRFTFPVNPNIHQYMSGTLPAAKNAFIHYTNGERTIQLHIVYVGTTSGIKASYDLGQQSLIINGNKVVLSESLTDDEFTRIEGVIPYDSSTSWDDFDSSFGSSPAPWSEMIFVMIQSNGVLYSLNSEDVSLYDLVRMAASMK